MNPLISIIVPVYNSEKTLDRCINSILEQTFQNWELLLINDGSTDRSREICDEYTLKDKRIKTIHKENGGVSSARNKGIKCSKGDYILMLDSDDSLELNTCESLMIMSEEKKQIVLYLDLNKVVEVYGLQAKIKIIILFRTLKKILAIGCLQNF